MWDVDRAPCLWLLYQHEWLLICTVFLQLRVQMPYPTYLWNVLFYFRLDGMGICLVINLLCLAFGFRDGNGYEPGARSACRQERQNNALPKTESSSWRCRYPGLSICWLERVRRPPGSPTFQKMRLVSQPYHCSS
ncbi:hypothetical protein B0H14DRAFT_2774483 [Mycena olivaceomarginata]|nr:hypothetical protein B0H14DRAFT_2774483 [Mycena olivaceomarginata]